MQDFLTKAPFTNNKITSNLIWINKKKPFIPERAWGDAVLNEVNSIKALVIENTIYTSQINLKHIKDLGRYNVRNESEK